MIKRNGKQRGEKRDLQETSGRGSEGILSEDERIVPNFTNLLIMISHRENIHRYNIFIHGVNDAMFRIDSSGPFPGKFVF